MSFRLLSLAFGILLATNAAAQLATQTAIVGTVTDSSGSVVPGAAVTAVNVGTQDRYKAVTNLFNRANFANPNATFGTANFGRITSADSMRQLQLGVKILY
jgi:hypothetical protein